MPIEFKQATLVEAPTETAGQFVARVAVTGNVDAYGDRLLAGAFGETLAAWGTRGARIPVVYAHAWTNPDALIGHVLEATEDGAGLLVKAQLDLDHAPAAHLFRAMQARTLVEFSVGFIAKAFQFVRDTGGELVREITAVDLIEVGPCLMGVNPATSLLATKAGRVISRANLTRLKTMADELATFVLEHERDEPPPTEDTKAIPAPAAPIVVVPDLAWVGSLETLLEESRR
jgi:HK97 family phage prohead protease